MQSKEKIVNNQKEEIQKQLSSMTAYGIDGLGLTPEPKKTIGNEDTIADMKNSKNS